MFAGIFSCTPSFSPEINKVYLILSYLMCMNIKIASVILDICIDSEPATTSGPRLGLLLARDTGSFAVYNKICCTHQTTYSN